MFACRKEATIKLPEQEPKLVVTCFINPEDTIITAVVRLSQPKFNPSSSSLNEYHIENASVVLSDGNTEVTLPYNMYLNAYKINASLFPIQNGKTYYLSVSTPDGKSASAQTTIPGQTLTYNDLNISLSNANRQYDGSLSVSDIAGTINYVAIYPVIAWASKQTALFPIGDTLFDRGTPIYDTDENISKTNYVFTLFDRIGNQGSYTPENNDTITYVETYFSILNCSKEFYLYNQTVRKAIQGNNNPFSDPVLIYTNINNGLGCFGGFNQTKFSKQLL